jgi:hypothetical protein
VKLFAVYAKVAPRGNERKARCHERLVVAPTEEEEAVAMAKVHDDGFVGRRGASVAWWAREFSNGIYYLGGSIVGGERP